MRSREATIAAAARALGFSRAGTAPLAPLPVGPFLAAWLAEGRAGEMGYLARRTAERIDPRAARPWARGVISLAYPYRPPPPPPGDWRATLTGRIAAYALGEDYHARVGALPAELRPHLGNWVFGCDLCQEACPWNGEARDTAGAEGLAPHLPSLLALDEAGFRARFGKTAVARAKRRGLLRNAAVALGNSGNTDAVPALAAALADPEPLGRGHAAWALGRLGGAAARRAPEAARARETDGGAAAERAAGPPCI